jgi:heme a synthase
MTATPAHRHIATWLLLICGLVMAMVVVGGVTRLTESGLSMTKWEPHRVLPPMTETDWQAEFTQYRQTPEYTKINKGMSLAQYKNIFWWEFAHRQLGRFIGLAYGLPLLWFWVKRQIPDGYHGRLLLLLGLGGLQAVIGWWMVASGLVDRPDVSHYRLTVHLMTALIIFTLCLWTAFSLLGRTRASADQSAGLRPWTLALAGALFTQLVLGGFVAGLNAGFASANWPMMQPGAFLPALANPLLDDPAGVQFLHRLGAYVVVALALACAWKSSHTNDPSLDAFGKLLAVLALCQTALGIATIMTGVPTWIAAAHQFGAVLFLGAFTAFAHRQFTTALYGEEHERNRHRYPLRDLPGHSIR